MIGLAFGLYLVYRADKQVFRAMEAGMRAIWNYLAVLVLVGIGVWWWILPLFTTPINGVILGILFFCGFAFLTSLGFLVGVLADKIKRRKDEKQEWLVHIRRVRSPQV